MTTRRAYAISKDGKAAFMFQSKALRDFFLENIDGYEKSTCAEYRKVERKSDDSLDEWGNTVRFSPYKVFDMSIDEYWDYDGWYEVYDAAYEAGLL